MLSKKSARGSRQIRTASARAFAEPLEQRWLMSLTWNTVGVANVDTRNTVTLDHAYTGNSDTYVDLQTQPDASQFPLGMYAVQDRGVYGANTQLAAAGSYNIKYHYDVWTWDSYSDPATVTNGGYFDAFSVSLSPDAYTGDAGQTDYTEQKATPSAANVFGGQTNTDPLEGPTWGLEHLVGNGTLNYTNPDPTQAMFLSVVVDTSSADQDPSGSLPSWGQVQITGINSVPSVNVSNDGNHFTFTRDPGTTGALNVFYRLGGTGSLGTDYTTSGDSGPDSGDPTLREVTIADGNASATVDLTSINSGKTATATIVANPGDSSGTVSYFENGDPGTWTS